MSESPELRLSTPAPAGPPGNMPGSGHARTAPLLTVPGQTRRAPAAQLPAGPRAHLDVSTVYTTRPRSAPAPLPFPPHQLTFVARPPAAPAPGGTGPVLTVSIMDRSSSIVDAGGPAEAPRFVVTAPVSGRWLVGASAASVLLVLAATGAATQLLPSGFADSFTGAPSPSGRPTTATASPGPVRTTGARTSPPTTRAATSAPPSPSPSLSPSPSATRPAVPDLALTMTDQAVLAELELQSRDGAPAVAALAGSWVPQVSFKCPGLRVDLGPNWTPDGVDDTAHVTVQQILAFHLSLHDRFGALTVHPTQLGMTADRGTSGACARQTIWMSVVPQAFPSAQAAKNWCDVNGLPIRECSARYVARPGERSTQVDRT